VIRNGLEFICGVCRNSYDNPAQANACLRRCWTAHTAIPVAPIASKTDSTSVSRWRCRACHRDYASMEAAQRCAVDCCSHLKMSFYSYATNDPSALVAPVFVLPPRRKQTAVAVPSGHSGLKRKSAAQATSDSHAPASANPASNATTAPPASEASLATTGTESTTASPPAPEATEGAATAPRKPKDRTKKFFRDGARYVCNECNAKFFTKNEVEACWEQHP